MSDPSGRELIALAQSGDADAMGALYDQNHEALFRYIWLKVGDRHLAEDLTGDVFVRMLAALPRYRPMQATFRAWLYRIAHNLVMDYYRKESNHKSVSLQHAETRGEEEATIHTLFEQKLTLERLRIALQSLEQTQREAVALRFLSGLSLQEAAVVMGKTKAALKALQHRGLSALRSALAQEGASDG